MSIEVTSNPKAAVAALRQSTRTSGRAWGRKQKRRLDTADCAAYQVNDNSDGTGGKDAGSCTACRPNAGKK